MKILASSFLFQLQFIAENDYGQFIEDFNNSYLFEMILFLKNAILY